MKKTMSTLIVAFLFFGVIQVPSFAQERSPLITGKQIKQERRIKQGVRSGELTRTEARMLKAEQKRVKLMKKGAVADGKITRRERTLIRKNQRIASKHIYRQKHDGQSRN
jgi:hypothetical protein